MEEFRVPQQEVPVEIRLRDGREFTGHMFVPVVGTRVQPEPLVDRLNDADRFLPVTRDGEFEMVNKSCIVLVRQRGPVPRSLEDTCLERTLSVDLDEGGVVEGRVRYLMPHERSRLLDFLNVAPRFIELVDDNVRTLVNSDFVMRIRTLTPDPA